MDMYVHIYVHSTTALKETLSLNGTWFNCPTLPHHKDSLCDLCLFWPVVVSSDQKFVCSPTNLRGTSSLSFHKDTHFLQLPLHVRHMISITNEENSQDSTAVHSVMVVTWHSSCPVAGVSISFTCSVLPSWFIWPGFAILTPLTVVEGLQALSCTVVTERMLCCHWRGPWWYWFGPIN